MVGISPLNRDGSGVNPVDVHELLSDILAAGWLDARVTAIAVEPSSQGDIAWDQDFFAKTAGLLGSVDAGQLKVLSLAGSHTNCVLRCCCQELRHAGDDFICHEGRLNMELLRKRDPAFHKAALDGMLWTVLSRAVAEQLPHLLSLVQRMGNATLQRSEHGLQLMRSLSTSGSHVDFADIKKLATTGKTVHSKALPHLYTFALKAAGGRVPFLLEETESFVRLQSPSTVLAWPDFWEKVSGAVCSFSACHGSLHALICP